MKLTSCTRQVPHFRGGLCRYQRAWRQSTDPIKIAINEWTGQHISAHIAQARS